MIMFSSYQCQLAVTMDTITYEKECININLGFELQPALLSELLLMKINQQLLTNQIQEFKSAVV